MNRVCAKLVLKMTSVGCKEFQVCQSVVAFVPIAVMNYFLSLQSATKVFFHHKSMFEN